MLSPFIRWFFLCFSKDYRSSECVFLISRTTRIPRTINTTIEPTTARIEPIATASIIHPLCLGAAWDHAATQVKNVSERSGLLTATQLVDINSQFLDFGIAQLGTAKLGHNRIAGIGV